MAGKQEFYVNIDMQGNQLVNARAETLTSLPAAGKKGRVVYIDATGETGGYYYDDGSAFIKVAKAADVADLKDVVGATTDDGLQKRVSDLENLAGIGGSGESDKTLPQQIQAVKSDLGTKPEGVTDAFTEIASVKSVAETLRDTTVPAIKTTADGAKSKADTNATAITALGGRIDALEATVDDESTGLVAKVTTLGGEMDAAQDDITALQAAVGTGVTGISTKVTTLEGKVGTLETTVGDASGGLVKTVADMDTAYKAADASIDSEISTIKSDYLKSADAANTYRKTEDSYSKNEVDTKISNAVSSAYVFKGTKTMADLNALGADGKKEGYVYNISDAFTDNGKNYPVGTNVAWVGDAATGGWDVLSGYTDFSVFAKSNDVTSAIGTAKAGAISSAKDYTDTKVADYVLKTTKVAGHELSADITLAKGDVGLGNVDNTSDNDKPISTATKSALDLKATAKSTGVGTWAKVTVNSEGIVTAGSDLAATDIPIITSAKISDFAAASVTAGKAIFSGAALSVSDEWQNVVDTEIAEYPSAITAYDADGKVINVSFKYDSTDKRVQYQTNVAVTATVVVSL